MVDQGGPVDSMFLVLFLAGAFAVLYLVWQKVGELLEWTANWFESRLSSSDEKNSGKHLRN